MPVSENNLVIQMLLHMCSGEHRTAHGFDRSSSELAGASLPQYDLLILYSRVYLDTPDFSQNFRLHQGQ